MLLLLFFFFFLTLPGILRVFAGDEDMQEVQDNGHAANGQQQDIQQQDGTQQQGSSGGKVINLTKSSNRVRHAYDACRHGLCASLETGHGLCASP